MTLPAIWLLLAFAILFLALVIMAIVHLYHAWRFGEHTPLAAITSGLFLSGIIALVIVTLGVLREVDWSQSFELTLPSTSIPGPDQLSE